MVRLKPKQVLYRRKRENRTNYPRRLKLLISGKPRLVLRVTNQKLIAQLVKFNPKGDKVIVAIDSYALKKLGWKHSCKNTPAAYLTGLLFGKKVMDKNIKEAVFDIGVKCPLRKSRIYSFLKGVLDSKLKVAHSGEIFPDEERITGKHISSEIVTIFSQVKSKIALNTI